MAFTGPSYTSWQLIAILSNINLVTFYIDQQNKNHLASSFPQHVLHNSDILPVALNGVKENSKFYAIETTQKSTDFQHDIQTHLLFHLTVPLEQAKDWQTNMWIFAYTKSAIAQKYRQQCKRFLSRSLYRWGGWNLSLESQSSSFHPTTAASHHQLSPIIRCSFE